MSRKSAGSNVERDLVRKFWEKGWSSIRVAGSGSMRFPSPDIVAGRKDRMVVIECKLTKETKKYLTKKEIEDLYHFAEVFGAEAWIYVKFKNNDSFFINPEDMEEKDASFLITLEQARNKGLLEDEFFQ